MPATAGRVRMPHNNRVPAGRALATSDIWSKTIGHDPYAANDDERITESEAALHAEKTKTLLSLAKSQNLGVNTRNPKDGTDDFARKMFLGLKEGKKRRRDDVEGVGEEGLGSRAEVTEEMRRCLEENSSSSEEEFVEEDEEAECGGGEGDGERRRSNDDKKKGKKKRKKKTKKSRRSRDDDSSDSSSDESRKERRRHRKNHRKRKEERRRERRKRHDRKRRRKRRDSVDSDDLSDGGDCGSSSNSNRLSATADVTKRKKAR